MEEMIIRDFFPISLRKRISILKVSNSNSFKRFKEEYPNKDIWIWSGDEIENILQDWRKNIIAYCDVLVCGPFIEEEKDLSLKYCGSRNQRVIDLKTGEVLSD